MVPGRRGHGREVVRAVHAQVGALREVLPQQPVGGLVGAAPPRAVGSQKSTCRRVSIRSPACWVSSAPRSRVSDRRSCSGRVATVHATASRTARRPEASSVPLLWSERSIEMPTVCARAPTRRRTTCAAQASTRASRYLPVRTSSTCAVGGGGPRFRRRTMGRSAGEAVGEFHRRRVS